VLYVAGEGCESIKMRVLAWRQHHGVSTNVAIVPVAVNLLDPAADIGKIIDAAEAVAKHYGMPVVKITVDTLARAFGGGNENASEDMGAVINSAGQLQDAFQCVLCFVHHCGKDETKGSRGHSSLKGATDVEISVRRDADIRTAIAEKVRDGGDQTALVTFRLQSVDLGPRHEIDPDADLTERITSCVLAPCDAPERSDEPRGKNQTKAFPVICGALAGGMKLDKKGAIKLIQTECAIPYKRAYETVEKLVEGEFLTMGFDGILAKTGGAK
jgi:hypothetical protein